MTLDDLEKIFSAVKPDVPEYVTADDLVAAVTSTRKQRLRAVVEALRDEFDFDSNIYEQFTEILGASPGDQAAGSEDSPEDRSPAADPSPAVCEWTPVRPKSDLHETTCGKPIWRCSEHVGQCPSCGKPIVFKEPKP